MNLTAFFASFANAPKTVKISTIVHTITQFKVAVKPTA
jgi:hypothetical protein